MSALETILAATWDVRLSVATQMSSQSSLASAAGVEYVGLFYKHVYYRFVVGIQHKICEWQHFIQCTSGLTVCQY